LDPISGTDITFNEKDVQFVLSLAGLHPMFIQIACSALFEDASHSGGQAKKRDYDAVTRDFLVEATQYFEDIWQDQDESRRDVLIQLALGGNVNTQQSYLVRELQKEGYLNEDETPVPFSRAFTEFLISKSPEGIRIPRTIRETEQTSLRSRIIRVFKRKRGSPRRSISNSSRGEK
jgi:hypothetical protein